MSATSQVVLEIAVEGGKAKRELADTAKSAESMGGSVEGLKKKLDKFDGATREASKVLRGMGDELGGTKSRMFDVLGVAADLGGAFASGGLFTVGLTAGTFAVTNLARAFGDNERQMKSWREFIKTTSVNEVPDLLKSIRDINMALGNFGKGATAAAVDNERALGRERETARDAAAATIAETTAQIEANKKLIASRPGMDAKDLQPNAVLEQQNKALEASRIAAREHLKNETAAIELGRRRLMGLIELEGKEKDAAADAKLKAEQDKDRQEALSKAEADKKKADDKAIARLHDRQAAELKLHTIVMDNLENEQRLKRLRDFENNDPEEKERKEREARNAAAAENAAFNDLFDSTGPGGTSLEDVGTKIEGQIELQGELAASWFESAASVENYAAVAEAALGALVPAAQGLVDDLITGQDDALEHFIANTMRAAGQSLVGSGTALAGQAVVSAFTPGLQVLAAAQGAAAAGLIGSGIALGGIATGIEHVAAGGTIGQKLPDPEKETPSANSRSRTNSGGHRSGGGGNTYVTNYGISGPQPDEVAREIARQNRRGVSRGFADRGVVVGR